MPTRTRQIDIAVVGAGAAGLTAAYSLRALGLAPLDDFLVMDASLGPGGHWQSGWQFLEVGRAYAQGELVDLPGQRELGLAFDTFAPTTPVTSAVPHAWRMYENAYDLFIAHGVTVARVESDRRREKLQLQVRTASGSTSTIEARVLINATSGWSSPFVPWYPGQGEFAGPTIHAYHLQSLKDFEGKRVLVVGGGRTAVELLLQLDRQGIESVWSTRREPDFHRRPALSIAPRPRFSVAEASDHKLRRVQRLAARGKYLPSDVSVRGIPLTQEVFEAYRRGVLQSVGRLQRFAGRDAVFESGDRVAVDAVVWATGGRATARYLAPLRLRDAGSAPKVHGGWSRRDERVAFLGYAPGVGVSEALDEAMRIGQDAIDLLEG